jgi:hypothetical protein
MAEIPAFQERANIDTNQDGVISPAERDQYLAREAPLLQSQQHLSANGGPLALHIQDASNELRSYPQDMLQSPLSRHTASFRIEPVAVSPADALAQNALVAPVNQSGWRASSPR